MIFDAAVDGRRLRVEVSGQDGRYTVRLDGRPLEVDLREAGGPFVSLLVDSRSYEAGLQERPGGYTVVLSDDVVVVDLVEGVRGVLAPPHRSDGPARVKAPMPGKVVRVLAGLKAGDVVGLHVGDDVSDGGAVQAVESAKK